MKTIMISAFMLCSIATVTQAQTKQELMAKLEPKSGSKVTGTVTFTQEGDQVHIVADIQNLTPGKHGFHIHEKADCSAPDAASAGGHFNPEHAHHGGVDTAERHAGDFGNLTADATGKAHLDWKGKGVMLSGPESILGKSVVVHEKEDDLKSDPAGNSGARVACGVIAAE